MIGEEVLLKPLTIDFCNEQYVSWLNNPIVNQYLEIRWEKHTLEKVKEFIEKTSRQKNSYSFAIIEKTDGRHIGNIKLGPINAFHFYADISYFIGETKDWGKGYTTEAIKLITNFGFKQLELHRLQAGVYQNNIGSIKALERVGYKMEGCLRKKFLSNNKYQDHLLFGLLREEFNC